MGKEVGRRDAPWWWWLLRTARDNEKHDFDCVGLYMSVFGYQAGGVYGVYGFLLAEQGELYLSFR